MGLAVGAGYRLDPRPVMHYGAPGDLPLSVAPLVAIDVARAQRHIDHLSRRSAAMVGDQVRLAVRDVAAHLDILVAYRMVGNHPAAAAQAVDDPGNELLHRAAKLTVVVPGAGMVRGADQLLVAAIDS